MFSSEFCKIFKNTFFYTEHLWTTPFFRRVQKGNNGQKWVDLINIFIVQNKDITMTRHDGVFVANFERISCVNMMLLF